MSSSASLEEKISELQNGPESHSVAPVLSEKPPEIPPEGGVAGWLCVVGSSFGLFCTFGFLAA